MFPASAGMYPRTCVGLNLVVGAPRKRGDVPLGHYFAVAPLECSPQAQGCTHRSGRELGERAVFPVRVRGCTVEADQTRLQVTHAVMLTAVSILLKSFRLAQPSCRSMIHARRS